MENFFNSYKKYEYYMQEYRELYAKRVQFTGFVILFLSCMGYFLAYFSYKQYFLNISIILIGWQLLTILILLFSYNKKILLSYAIILKHIIVISTNLSLCFMIYITGGVISPYYTGLNLVIIGSSPMFLYTMKDTVKECSIIILCYIITVLIPNNIPFDFGIFFNNLYFMVLFSIGSIVIAYEATKNRVAEFNQRYDLKKANEIKTQKQEELEKALDQLQDAFEQLKAMQVKIVESEKVKTLGLVAAGVVHEITNPLNFIIPSIEAMRVNYEIAPEIEEVIERIYRGAIRIDDVVSNLRHFATGGYREAETFSLNNIIESSLKYASRKTENIIVKTDIEENMNITGYKGDILSLFLNLITNAADALKGTDKQDKKIEISCYKKDKKACVKIKDNGPGIKKEDIEKLFIPFYTTKNAGKGMGLGLCISASIVKNHGSELKVKSILEEFTEFSFELPL